MESGGANARVLDLGCNWRCVQLHVSAAYPPVTRCVEGPVG
jgi:hypothetical protein